MAFAAIHIPEFPVQSVIRAEPALLGAAIALMEGTPPTCKVFAANEAASRLGIELGMAQTLVEQFESVQIRVRSRAQEKAAHAALLDLGWSLSPRVEDTAQDTIAVDIAGLSSLFGTDEAIAGQLAQSALALGLAAHVAIAFNLQVAIHASCGFPGITQIAPEEEATRLGGLPVRVLGPPNEILETMERWGVRTCADLAALPVLRLSERLGQAGVQLQEWARGGSIRSLVLAERSTCFEEEMELEDSVEELEPLAFLLGHLLNQLCARLQTRSLAFQAIHVRFDLDLSGKKERQVKKEQAQPHSESAVYKKTLTLPLPMRDSTMLLSLLRLQLQGDPPASPIVKIIMSAEAAHPRALQVGMFVPASPDPEKLELTIARLASLVGHSNIGSPQLVNTHRPDEFSMDRFVPAREEAKTIRRRKGRNDAPGPVPAENELLEPTKPAIGFRMFRPPLPASVQLKEGRPLSVGFRGARGKVLAASGPWRTSGDWWREDTWHQDEWDLEIHFQVPSKNLERSPASYPQQGLYRFYYDSICRSWFVRGMYD